MILRLELLDEALHFPRILRPMAVALDRTRPSGRLNIDIAEEGARVHPDGRDVGHVDRVLASPNQRWVCWTIAVGVIWTCVGNSRLPALNRLARKTCPVANG